MKTHINGVLRCAGCIITMPVEHQPSLQSQIGQMASSVFIQISNLLPHKGLHVFHCQYFFNIVQRAVEPPVATMANIPKNLDNATREKSATSILCQFLCQKAFMNLQQLFLTWV